MVSAAGKANPRRILKVWHLVSTQTCSSLTHFCVIQRALMRHLSISLCHRNQSHILILGYQKLWIPWISHYPAITQRILCTSAISSSPLVKHRIKLTELSPVPHVASKPLISKEGALAFIPSLMSSRSPITATAGALMFSLRFRRNRCGCVHPPCQEGKPQKGF